MARARAERVLVTRSEPGATELASALARAGFDAVVQPVIEVRPVDPPQAQVTARELRAFHLAIFLSVHAVRFGVPLLATDRGWPRALPCIAIGRATARALIVRGIAAASPATETSEGILRLPELAQPRGRRTLIVAGRGGRRVLGNELRARGAIVTELDVYERARAADLHVDPRGIDAVVISSAETGRIFATAWRGANGPMHVRLIAPSARVCEALASLGFTRVFESAGAGSDAVVAALLAVEDDG